MKCPQTQCGKQILTAKLDKVNQDAIDTQNHLQPVIIWINKILQLDSYSHKEEQTKER